MFWRSGVSKKRWGRIVDEQLNRKYVQYEIIISPSWELDSVPMSFLSAKSPGS